MFQRNTLDLQKQNFVMKHILLLLSFLVIFSGLSAQNIYDVNRIQELRITFKDSNWDRTLDSLKQLGTKKRIEADVKLNGITYRGCGVRFKGNSSYNSTRNLFGKKLPLNIKSDYTNDNQKFPGGYDRLKLANGFRDPSFIREVLSYEIAAKYMHVPKANFMHVYIDEEYYGLYTSVESIGEKFIKDHFGQDDAVLIKCDPEYGIKPPSKCPKGTMKATLHNIGSDSTCYAVTYESKSLRSDYKSLIQLTKTLKDNVSKVNKELDIDQTLWMLAFNNVLVNLDSYSGRLAHNYYMVQDVSGRWVPLIWDLNMSFGGFRYDGGDKSLDNKSMIEMSPFLHYKNTNKPLISQLLSIPRYRKIYIAHIQTILEENFYNGWYKQRAQRLQSVVDYALKNDENKFYSYSSFKENLKTSSKAGKSQIIGIEELMEGRAAFLKAHPLFQKEQPKISGTRHQKSSGKVVITSKIENAKNVYLAYRFGKKGYFSKKPMHDDGNHKDFQAGDGFYGIELEIEPGMQYYILAENEKTVKLDPVNAEYKFHEVR